MNEGKEYSQVIQTIKSLLMQKKISVSAVRKMLSDKKITTEEYEYIIKRD
jgi:hypothetical protein